ncbi:MAG: haloacid dehalogenase type II [Chloroflexi bacterium]|nr:haloacid dehalogenase type II [Chloroflexota bacterium]MDA1147424.1 haloacid dehalogenase type II [Chloroflexota bacterium]
MNPELEHTKVLTFDLFGTILDLGGSLTPHIARFLEEQSSDAIAAEFWQQLRYRQRIEQYQDSLVELGHSGYLETVEKAFSYVSRLNGLDPSRDEIKAWMESWQQLSPFPEVVAGLDRLRTRFKLVALSNGNPWFLDHLVKNRIHYEFDDVLSVELVGIFKPSPAVYRRAARELNSEPSELLMVSANSFDVMGARMCGLRGAYVDRYGLPFEDTDERYHPDVTVLDFTALANALGV